MHFIVHFSVLDLNSKSNYYYFFSPLFFCRFYLIFQNSRPHQQQTRHTVSCVPSWPACTTKKSPRPPASNTVDPSHPIPSTSSCPSPRSMDAWSEEPPSMPRNSDASSTTSTPNKHANKIHVYQPTKQQYDAPQKKQEIKFCERILFRCEQNRNQTLLAFENPEAISHHSKEEIHFFS